MRLWAIAAACGVLGWSSAAAADTISSGETKSATVAGQASVYQVFGRAGNTGGDYGPAQDASLFEFLAGSGNIFTFSAGGEIGCCGGIVSGWGPDGAAGATSVGGINGLSSLSGNALIPLVGVFTTDADPFGGVAPSALSFDATAGGALSPLLHQVFYIGDGRSGFNDGAGAILQFTAPTAATRLYIGTLDAFSFAGTSGYYNDNPGSFDVRITLGAIPEPSTWAMMILGLGSVGALLRRRPLAPA